MYKKTKTHIPVSKNMRRRDKEWFNQEIPDI